MDHSTFYAESLHSFLEACKKNILPNIKSFVQQKYPINSRADSSFGEEFTGYTPLHFAVKNKNEEIVSYLLKNGADITVKNTDGQTPVHLAFYIKAFNLVFTIFQHSSVSKIYDNVVDRSGHSLFYICCAVGVSVLEKFMLAENNRGFTSLHFAVQNDYDLPTVRLLIENNANPNITCEGGFTPLHIACRSHDSATVAELLLSFAADPNIKDNKGCTALHCAVEHQRLNTIEVLVKNGASIHEPNNENQTPLDLAVKNRQYAVVDTMLSLCKNDNKTPSFSDIFNIDDFCSVCSEENVNNVKTFLKYGFSVNSQAGSNVEIKFRGYTPLHFAVKQKREDIIICLLENGADITKKADNGWTPIHLAYYNSSKYLIPILFNHSVTNTFVNVADDRGLTHFHICCALGIKTNSIQNFLTNGTDINCATSLHPKMDDSGFTPLHFVVERGFTSNIEFLLKNGADHSLKCRGGLTPLHLACELDAIDSAKLLLKAGADLLIKDHKNRLPLHCAFYKNPRSHLVDLLFENISTDYNYTDVQRLSILHMASLRHKIPIVKRLLAQGCCPNGRIIKMTETSSKTSLMVDGLDIIGLTPLHMALRERNLAIIKELLLAGADINAEDSKGYCTLSYFYNLQGNINTKPFILAGYNLEIDVQIANQLKKMDVAELYINEKAKREFYGRKIPGARPRFIIEQIIDHQMCMNELEKMQRIKINEDDDENLHSILNKTEKEMAWLIYNKDLETYLSPERLDDLVKEFPLYGFMIKSQVNKGLRKIARDEQLQKAKDSLNCLAGIRLPDLVTELIFSHLRIYHIENLIDANIQNKDHIVSSTENEYSREPKKRKL